MKSGRRRSTAGYVFFLAPRETGGARLGILISRRHAALASDRNRIKRCIREAFRQEHHRLPAMDLLVRPPIGLKPGRAAAGRLRELLAGLEP
jgi:ribonuclease P protein component